MLPRQHLWKLCGKQLGVVHAAYLTLPAAAAATTATTVAVFCCSHPSFYPPHRCQVVLNTMHFAEKQNHDTAATSRLASPHCCPCCSCCPRPSPQVLRVC